MRHRQKVKHPFLGAVLLLLAGTAIAQAPRVRRAVEPVPGRYLVVLKTGPEDVSLPAVDQEALDASRAEAVELAATDLLSRHGGRRRLLYSNAFSGFSADLTEGQADALSRDPAVAIVDEVAVVRLSSTQTLPLDDKLWHLDRIDQRGTIYLTAGDNRFNYCEAGGGTYAYVIDTGINRDHQEFLRADGTSRVINGVKFAPDHYVRYGETDDYGTLPCGGWVDNYTGGHGTAVASLIGGKTYGVAKNVTLVPIRIFSCSGVSNTEWLAWGIDWIRGPANPYRLHRPAVVNISLRIFDTDPLVSAVESSINGLVLNSTGWTGIPVIVSANNQGSSNSRTSPARMAYQNAAFPTPGHVISVGGIAENDARWQCRPETEPCNSEPALDGNGNWTTVPGGSNYGNTVDIFAPAHNIEAAHIASSASVRTIYELRSGTSFSAPLVTGLAARILEVQPTLTPVQVWNTIKADATQVGFAIDPVTGNQRVAYRAGFVTCTPEYP